MILMMDDDDVMTTTMTMTTMMMVMMINGSGRDGGGGDGGGGIQCQQTLCGWPWTQCPLSIVTELVHYYDNSYIAMVSFQYYLCSYITN